MDLDTIEAFVEDRIPEDEEFGLELLLVQLGKMGELLVHLKSNDVSDEDRRDMFEGAIVGTLLITVELALDEGVDISDATERAIAEVEKEDKYDSELMEAMEEGDYEKMEELLFEEDEPEETDEEDGRAFY